MLYETLFQFDICLCILYFGIIAGLFFEAKNLIEKSFKENIVVCILLDTLFCIVASFIFVIAKNSVNFGQFRLYMLFSFIFGIFIERISIGFLVEKIFLFVYNKVKFVAISVAKFFNKIFKKVFKIRWKKKKSGNSSNT